MSMFNRSLNLDDLDGMNFLTMFGEEKFNRLAVYNEVPLPGELDPWEIKREIPPFPVLKGIDFSKVEEGSEQGIQLTKSRSISSRGGVIQNIPKSMSALERELADFLKYHGCEYTFTQNAIKARRYNSLADLVASVKSKSKVIVRAFRWMGTPEGYNYWKTISQMWEKHYSTLAPSPSPLPTVNQKKSIKLDAIKLEAMFMDFLDSKNALRSFGVEIVHAGYSYTQLFKAHPPDRWISNGIIAWTNTKQGFSYWQQLEAEWLTILSNHRSAHSNLPTKHKAYIPGGRSLKQLSGRFIMPLEEEN